MASQATIDVVQLWEGVGSCATSTYTTSVLNIAHVGLISGYIYVTHSGTGTPGGRWRMGGGAFPYDWRITLAQADTAITMMLVDNDNLSLGGTVATDINCILRMDLTLRSEQ